jgi:hypothetical protein
VIVGLLLQKQKSMDLLTMLLNPLVKYLEAEEHHDEARYE